MKRWMPAIMILQGAALVFLGGCNKASVLPENLVCGLDQAASPGPLDPLGECLPSSVQPFVPRSVNDLAAKRRPISLATCVALALENGRLNGESIRVLAYDPAVAATDIEQSLSRFDTQLVGKTNWNSLDPPLSTPTNGLLFNNGANFNSQLIKPLPTGGVAGINFMTDYQDLSHQPQPSNVYQPTLGLVFEQPLLQGYGVFINELTDSHPGSIQLPLQTSSAPGILLARMTFDQTRADFDQHVEDLVLAVEQAYWNLYISYWILYSRDQILHLVAQEYTIGRQRMDKGQITVQDLAQIEEQFHLLRAERITVLGSGLDRAGVLEAERLLRQAIGLPAEDGCQLVPLDEPTVTRVVPKWEDARAEAVRLRPELVKARQEVEKNRLMLAREKNFLLPDLRFVSGYDLTAAGTQLDGSSSDNALRQLSSNHFNNWTVGLQLQMPIGFRAANAAVRKVSLQLAQSMANLENLEQIATFDLLRSYRLVVQSYEVMGMQRARRLAAARQVEARLKEFHAGLGEVTFLLQAQQSLADALQAEQSAIGDYNVALADFERQKGTILHHDKVDILEGPLPARVQERASAHIEERRNALRLREPAPVAGPWLTVEGNSKSVLTEGGLPFPDFEAKLTETPPSSIADVPPSPGAKSVPLPPSPTIPLAPVESQVVTVTDDAMETTDHEDSQNPSENSQSDRVRAVGPEIEKKAPSDETSSAPQRNSPPDLAEPAAAGHGPTSEALSSSFATNR